MSDVSLVRSPMRLRCVTAMLVVSALGLSGCWQFHQGPGAAPEPSDGGSTDACAPTAEACNGADDDCDGAVDEDFDLAEDVSHCGTCGNECVASAETCGVASCTAGVCALAPAPDGYACSDDDPCTHDDACRAGRCAGRPRDGEARLAGEANTFGSRALIVLSAARVVFAESHTNDETIFAVIDHERGEPTGISTHRGSDVGLLRTWPLLALDADHFVAGVGGDTVAVVHVERDGTLDIVARFEPDSALRHLATDGERLYAWHARSDDAPGTLAVWDLAVRASPVRLGAIELDHGCLQLHADPRSGRLWVLRSDAGVQRGARVLDARALPDAVVETSTPIEGVRPSVRMTIAGDDGVVVVEHGVLSVLDAADGTTIGSIHDGVASWGAFTVEGTTLYAVADVEGERRFRAYDLASGGGPRRYVDRAVDRHGWSVTELAARDGIVWGGDVRRVRVGDVFERLDWPGYGRVGLFRAFADLGVVAAPGQLHHIDLSDRARPRFTGSSAVVSPYVLRPASGPARIAHSLRVYDGSAVTFVDPSSPETFETVTLHGLPILDVLGSSEPWIFTSANAPGAGSVDMGRARTTPEPSIALSHQAHAVLAGAEFGTEGQGVALDPSGAQALLFWDPPGPAGAELSVIDVREVPVPVARHRMPEGDAFVAAASIAGDVVLVVSATRSSHARVVHRFAFERSAGRLIELGRFAFEAPSGFSTILHPRRGVAMVGLADGRVLFLDVDAEDGLAPIGELEVTGRVHDAEVWEDIVVLTSAHGVHLVEPACRSR